MCFRRASARARRPRSRAARWSPPSTSPAPFTEDAPLILIDALRDEHGRPSTARCVCPTPGCPAQFDDQAQQDLAAALEEQTGGNRAPLVFFCQGAQCWESYNASLRAINLGYTNVYWYRGGLAAWTEAKLPLE